MGSKKKSGRGSSKNQADADADADPKAATAFVLKVPTHCRCDGCGDKVRAAVKDLALRCDGIVSLDRSALATKGELAVVATADPERLRRRLRKATGKDVALVFPKKQAAAAAAADGGNGGKDAAASSLHLQALLAAGLQLQQQQQQQQQQAVHVHHGHPLPAAGGGWNALPHGGYGQAAYYPWVLPQQQATPAEAYLASYPAAAYPAASWAAYPHDGVGGAYGGGGWLRF